MKLTDLTNNVPNVLGKFKSMLDNFTSSNNTEAAEEALSKETNPEKSKVLQVQLALSKLQDLQVLQANLYNELKQQLAELLKVVGEPVVAPVVEVAEKPVETTVTTTTTETKINIEEPK